LIRIVTISPNVADNQSFWRSYGPLSLLSSVDSDIDVVAPANIDWTTIMPASLVYMQRPFDAKHLQVARFTKIDMGKPLVVDFDDDLWDLPQGNPAWLLYNDEWRTMARHVALLANICIASTEPIAERLRSFGCKNVRVIENALPEYYKWRPLNPNKVVLWRGGDFHRHDLESVQDEFIAVVKKNPNWHFLFAGCNPTFVTRHLAEYGTPECNWSAKPTIPLTEFHRMLQDVAPAIVINPLDDHTFNRAKSNIGWIEAALAGAAILAPDFEQYRKPGARNYKPGEFGTALQAMLDGDMPDVQAARDHIDKRYRLTAANKQRLAVLRELCPR